MRQEENKREPLPLLHTPTDHPLKEFLLLVCSLGIGVGEEPIAALINWKPCPQPSLFVLPHEAKRRGILLITRWNVTARGRLGRWVREDYVWQPGDM